MGHRREDRPQGLMARTRPAGPLLASPIVMPRGDASPGRSPGRGANAGHVDPGLRHPALRPPLVKARNGVQEDDRPTKRQCGVWRAGRGLAVARAVRQRGQG